MLSRSTDMTEKQSLTGLNKPLFELGGFTLHSGQASYWRINAEALDADSLVTIAEWVSIKLPPFGSVEGVPTGGLALAEAFKEHVTFGPVLIVDDVFTTGKSMEMQRDGRKAIGFVV